MQKNRRSWDYIVVGGGTSGCVVAAQLAQGGVYSVLLIEAGGRRSGALCQLPLAFPMLARIPGLNWVYQSEPQSGADGRTPNLRMGRGLGGSSLVNGMVWARGHPDDYNAWSSLGAKGWGYADVLPWLKAAEAHWRGTSQWRGGKGPVSIRRASGPFAITKALQGACAEQGIMPVEDLACPPYEGIAPGEFAIDRGGRRVNAASAFLAEPVPANLTISAKTKVERIVIEQGRAIGVEVAGSHGHRHIIRAEREVILCAGAYQSPHLLMLSGIGEPQILHEAGVPLRHVLPGVGRNLQNHVTVNSFHRLRAKHSFPDRLRVDRLASAALAWACGHAGTLGQIPLAAIAQYRSRTGLARPDMQALYTEGSFLDGPWLPGQRPQDGHRMMITHALLRPAGRGRLWLDPADPQGPPRLDFALLTNDDDVGRLCDGLSIQRRILGRLERDGVLGGDARGIPQGDLENFVRRNAGLSQHPVGTCVMGEGEMAVVDSQLRVRGIEQLRVIDASVMPEIPGANTYATTVMIAMRGAAMVHSA